MSSPERLNDIRGTDFSETPGHRTQYRYRVFARLAGITVLSSAIFILLFSLAATTYAQTASFASFTTDVNAGQAPLTVHFTDTSSNSPASWQWSFDDGSPNATTRNVDHTFNKAGIYNVMLTVRGMKGTSTWCKRIVAGNDDSLSLMANGNKITYHNGTAVVLSGTSICPYEAIENKHLTSDQIDATLREMKTNCSMNAVRLVVFPQEWSPAYRISDGFPSGKAMYDLDRFVSACMRNGMYAIIEWHNYGTPDCYNITNESIYNPCLWFWQNASKLYGGNSMVMFELYNEPGWFPWPTWRSQAQNIANSIRQNSDNMIVVSGVRTAYYVKEVPSNPVTGTNIAYSTHCYADYHLFSGSWDEIMKPAAVSVPVLMTEWGTAIWTQGMHMNASIVHSYLHLLPYYMRDNGWDGSFAWNWDPSLGGTPMVNSITPPFHYTDWGDYARNVMLGNMPPYADIEASGNLYVGGAVDIKDSLGWGVTARDWDFGDGSAHGTERNVTHVYRTPGTYTLTLIATNSSYIDTMYSLDVITKDITITATSTSSQASDSCLFIGLIAGAAGSIFNFLESFI